MRSGRSESIGASGVTAIRRHNPGDQDADQEGPGASAPDNSMERTRFFRRPVVWIILVIIGAIALSSFFTSGPSYQRVDTSVALERLNQPGIVKVVQKDKEQTLQIDLAQPQEFAGKLTNKIETQYAYGVTSQIWTDVNQAKAAGRLTGTINPPRSGDSILFSLLINLLPIAILVVLLLLFMSQMQGGGSRV